MSAVDYFAIIRKYISPSSDFYQTYIPHVTLVTNKAVQVATRLSLPQSSLQFIKEAGMLHDIGIVKVKGESWSSQGDLPYICHGNQGRQILEAEGLPRHALVAERHTGVGISLAEIENRQLPLPHHDMIPQTVEERIISYADLFYSKSPHKLWLEESVQEIEQELAQFGQEQVDTFRQWHQVFS